MTRVRGGASEGLREEAHRRPARVRPRRPRRRACRHPGFAQSKSNVTV